MALSFYRVAPWAAAVVFVGFAGIVVARVVRKPAAPAPEAGAPHWEARKDTSDPDLIRGLEARAAGKDEEAVALLSKVLERDPGNWIALGNRANVYDKLKRPAEAVADMERLVKAQPTRGDLLGRIAWIKFRAGNAEEARAAAMEAITQRPLQADPYLILSELDAPTDVKKAVSELEQYLRNAWKGGALDEDVRLVVEARRRGTYIRRVIEMLRKDYPPGPEGDARAELEAHWYAALQYVDFAPDVSAKYPTLDHLLIYEELAKAHGDPDAARFKKSQEMIPKLKEALRKNEILPSEMPGGSIWNPKKPE